MIREVRNIDKNTSLFFEASTPYEAMQKLIYYLSTSDGTNAESAVINKTESNKFLYVLHNSDTYATRM